MGKREKQHISLRLTFRVIDRMDRVGLAFDGVIMSSIGNKPIFDELNSAWESLQGLGITSNLSEEDENVWLDSVGQALDGLGSVDLRTTLIRQRPCLSRISGIMHRTGEDVWDAENVWHYLATVGELSLRLIEIESHP